MNVPKRGHTDTGTVLSLGIEVNAVLEGPAWLDGDSGTQRGGDFLGRLMGRQVSTDGRWTVIFRELF